MTNINDKIFISIKEAVTLTGISGYSLRQMIKNHEIAYIECGKKFMLNRVNLLEHLEAESLNNMGR